MLRLTAGCSVEIDGMLTASEGKGQAFEIKATAVRVVGWVDDPLTYPITPKRQTYEYLREVAHLRPRTNTFGAVARVRHTAWRRRSTASTTSAASTGSTRRSSRRATRRAPASCSASPRSTSSTSRGPRTARSTSRRTSSASQAFLTVSGQLNVETYCLALTRVYTFGPTFRAENSNTSRHLAEFWMIEPEIAFADLNDNANLAEDFLRYIFQAVLDERADDMAFFAERVDKTCVSRLEAFVKSSFERMTYTEAIAALEKSGKAFEFPVRWGIDLQSEHERYLTEELVGRPVVVTNYPKDDQGVLHAPERRRADRGGDGRAGAGHRRDHRRAASARSGSTCSTAGSTRWASTSATYWWYRDLRRYGTVPHAGFGLGFERAHQLRDGPRRTSATSSRSRARPKSAEF